MTTVRIRATSSSRSLTTQSSRALTPTQADALPQSWLSDTYGPGYPVQPLASQQRELFEPREIDYPVAVNATLQPRVGYGLMPFGVLKSAYDAITEVSLPVRTIVREILGFRPRLVDDDKKEVFDHPYHWICESPDRELPYATWMTRFVKCALIYDAAAFHIQAPHGELQALDYIDGSTLMLIINSLGRLPKPTEISDDAKIRERYIQKAQSWAQQGNQLPSTTPAFAQVVHGTPYAWWDQDQIWYVPSSRAVDAPYGETFIERSFVWINIVANMTGFELAHYRTGNMPEGWVEAPQGWTSDRITLWENTFNARMSSGPAERMRVRFLPAGFQYHETKKPDFQQKLYDRATDNIALEIGLPPSEHGKVPGQGLGGKGFGEAMESALFRNALMPVKGYIEGAMNGTLKRFGVRDVRYELALPTLDVDPDKQKESIKGLFAAGIYTLNQALGMLELDEVPGGDIHMVVSGGQVIVLEEYMKNPDTPPSQVGTVNPNPLQLEPGPKDQGDVEQAKQLLDNAARTGKISTKTISVPAKPKPAAKPVPTVQKQLGKVDATHSDGGMIAVMIPLGAAQQLRQITEALGLPESAQLETPENMHVTLAFLPDGNAAEQQRSLILDSLTSLASNMPFLDGKIQGYGVFNGKDGVKVLFALLDEPQLPFLRTAICEALDGIGVAYGKDYGFVPHITMAYFPEDCELPAGFTVPDIPVQIDEVTLTFGNTRNAVQFAGVKGETSRLISIEIGGQVVKLTKHCGVCPEDDDYFGAPITREATIRFAEDGSHANGVEVVAATPDGLEPKPFLWKPEGSELESLQDFIGGPQYTREEAAYLLDRSLGFMLVPVAYVAEASDEIGAAVYYTHGLQTPRSLPEYGEQWVERAGVLDYIAGQQDRGTYHNWATHPDDPQRMILFDNGLTFPVDDGGFCQSPFCDQMAGKPLSRETLAALMYCRGDAATWADIQRLVGAEATAQAKARLQQLIAERAIPTGEAMLTQGSGGL